MKLTESPFKLTAPCADCPFRREGAIYLRPGRLEQIIAGLLRGGNFICHKLFYTNRRRQRQPCAGAIIFLEKAGRPNTVMQVMERLDAYPRAEFLRHANLVIDQNPVTFIAGGRHLG